MASMSVAGLHLDTVIGAFRKQSSMLNLVRFYARRHYVYLNLKNESGV